MDLITTHMNADFDALGSMVAAKSLYPNSRILLPGSTEEAVREFLLLAKDLIVVESERECQLDDIDRLVLVDTRHRSRIGVAAELVDRGIEVHIYDHHPRMKGDIVADKDVYEEVGATVTILADLIKKKRIRLSYLEATLMLLGIYEETGSLTYRTTTKSDVDMVSFLLSQGANLSVVSSYLNRELTESEMSLLIQLINSSSRTIIKGVSISFIEIDSSDYIGELGLIIHKLMEIENIPALFVLINTQRDRIDIIGRSSIPAIDVNKVLGHFEGGGHPTAASAKVRGVKIATVKKELLEILNATIKISKYAKDIMSEDVETASPDDRIDTVKKNLENAGLSAVPVTKDGKIVGTFSIDDANKAIRRGFGHSRIKGYMSRTFVTVKLDTPLHVLQRIILDKDANILPVLKKGKMIGAVNRTDVLRSIHRNMFLKPLGPSKKNVIENMTKKMKHVLPDEIVRLLKKIGGLANSLDCTAFVVGGLVRDLILGVKNLDLDIVVEGDAIKLGQELRRVLNGSLVVHKKFGTCSVITKDKLKIDLATARKEVYEAPAALPTVVEFSALKDDLIRRDFTINAMAISLNKASFGQLIDFFNGERDLVHGRIRVMHDLSFIDDPTRIFRAVRFEQRFVFTIDSHTEDLIKNAIEKEMFDRVEPQRIRDEIVLILKEKEPLKALRRMAELDELRFLHPNIVFDQRTIGLLRSVDEIIKWYDSACPKKRVVERWLIYLMVLFENLTVLEVSHITTRFVFRRGERMRITSFKKHGDKIIKALSSKKAILPSKVYRLLEPLSFEAILSIMAKADSGMVRSRIRDFIQKYNGTKISLRGEDIKRMGLKPCPDFKMILRRILYEKINGRLKTKKDEISFAAKLVKKICG